MTPRRLLPRPPALAPLLLVAAVAACDAPAPATMNFAWQGAIPGDGWVRVRNLNGEVKVLRSPDAQLTLSAAAKGDVRHARLLRQESAEGIVTCVVFADGDDCGRLGERRGGGLRRLTALFGGRTRETRVAWTLYVPEGARVDVQTVNGAVRMESVAREFRARTVNGAIHATAIGGALDAETVNGSIEATFGLADPAGAVSLKSVNGSVTAELPASLAGEVSLKTVNGSVRSDFDVQGHGSDAGASRRGRGPRAIEGSVGTGGAQRVTLRTVNGSATLRRRG